MMNKYAWDIFDHLLSEPIYLKIVKIDYFVIHEKNQNIKQIGEIFLISYQKWSQKKPNFLSTQNNTLKINLILFIIHHVEVNFVFNIYLLKLKNISQTR
ncbi:hypothetical protein BpHYR1_003478 [Brachionus plicatilis]|uniref:Uncharacterized protein n=1 Tax=Brachionus plicatilis TaxID=10195 RepID=A0A3M7T0S7_BRAPC|nr:hypothetical protein BpHYR1_003478 [Brachionus plicatilis]